MSFGPIIALEENSLYICTRQIMSDVGKFHWSFFLTNSSGIATELQWCSVNPKDYGGKCEAVTIGTVHPVTTYTKDYIMMFAYLKVEGFDSPGLEPVKAVALEAFPEDKRLGYADWQENRAAGLSCRTWVRCVMEIMQTKGWLRRSESPQWFEDKVKEISMDLEEKVARNELDASFVGTI